ncbi:Hypothetical_protein [Hexamita inflata]|uniref:Hypothetical_protein n=1 Tax=Hexamita inflata TaxID=28002 RepID=A0ABP1HR08_9EUKA
MFIHNLTNYIISDITITNNSHHDSVSIYVSKKVIKLLTRRLSSNNHSEAICNDSHYGVPKYRFPKGRYQVDSKSNHGKPAGNIGYGWNLFGTPQDFCIFNPGRMTQVMVKHANRFATSQEVK